MTTAAQNPPESASTRRWPRHQVELPIRIAAASEVSPTVVPGLAIEISRCGMALYAGVHLQPGDRMEVEFQTASRMRIAGVVRNREGYCYGVEFRSLVARGSAAAGYPNAAATVAKPSGLIETGRGDTAGAGRSEDAASYAAIHAELLRAEDKVAELLRRRLDTNMVRIEPEIKRLCLDLLRVRELRRQIEVLMKTT